MGVENTSRKQKTIMANLKAWVTVAFYTKEEEDVVAVGYDGHIEGKTRDRASVRLMVNTLENTVDVEAIQYYRDGRGKKVIFEETKEMTKETDILSPLLLGDLASDFKITDGEELYSPVKNKVQEIVSALFSRTEDYTVIIKTGNRVVTILVEMKDKAFVDIGKTVTFRVLPSGKKARVYLSGSRHKELDNSEDVALLFKKLNNTVELDYEEANKTMIEFIRANTAKNAIIGLNKELSTISYKYTDGKPRYLFFDCRVDEAQKKNGRIYFTTVEGGKAVQLPVSFDLTDNKEILKYTSAVKTENKASKEIMDTTAELLYLLRQKSMEIDMSGKVAATGDKLHLQVIPLKGELEKHLYVELLNGKAYVYVLPTTEEERVPLSIEEAVAYILN